nr:unnamed protein product [Spirometra erinaceieuropaei]
MFKCEKDTGRQRETLPVLSGLNFPSDDAEPHSSKWIYTHWAKVLLRSAAMVSLASVSANTPKTFEYVPSLMYVTFAVDIMVACLLTVEMGTKMCIQGLFAPSAGQDLNQLIKKQIAAKSLGVGVDTKRNKAYFQQSWNCFDASMVFFLWASIILQCFELRAAWECGPKEETCTEELQFWRQYGWLSVLRCPRPLILIRVFRAVLKLQLPPARVNAIFQRSTHQIYNVSVFLLFFMSLYGLLGVQFFGDELNYHCVLKTANERLV